MEQRKSQRFKIHQMVETSLAGERFVPVEGVDISEGGMSCCASEPVDPSARMELLITLPRKDGEYVLKTEAKVVHVEKKGDDYCIGVQFDSLFADDKEALRAYLQTLKNA